MSDNQYDNDNFAVLEMKERQRMANQPSAPPPAAPPKIPTCSYCGQPLNAPHANCPFCPERPDVQEGPNSPDNGGNEPLKATMRGYFEDEADGTLPRDPFEAARFLGLGR
jgi:hypothetical protein